MEGSTVSMPGRGRSDSRPGTRETVLRTVLISTWSLPLRRSYGRNTFKNNKYIFINLSLWPKPNVADWPFSLPRFCVSWPLAFAGTCDPSPHAFLLPVTAISESPVQLQFPGKQSNASKTSQMANATIAEPTGNGASCMWSPKRDVYIPRDSEFSCSQRWTLIQIILSTHHA